MYLMDSIHYAINSFRITRVLSDIAEQQRKVTDVLTRGCSTICQRRLAASARDSLQVADCLDQLLSPRKEAHFLFSSGKPSYLAVDEDLKIGYYHLDDIAIMSAQCKYYFLAPTWHNHPKSGTLQLGNIMTDLKAPGPERPLYRGPPPPPPRLVNTPPDVGSEERTESYQTNYEFSMERLRAGKFGIWTKFLSVLGLGVDFGSEWDKSKAEIYTFKHLETVEFSPSDEYIQKCLTAPPVARVISRTKKPLYIVTGIKAVTGATARTSDATGKKGRVGVEVDGTLLGGAPVSLGPEAEIERRTGQEVAFDGGSDFVFAFRVQRIRISRKGEASHEDYIKGAMLDAHKPPRRLEVDNTSFNVSELERVDLEAEGFQVEDVGPGEACGW